jgi:DNA-binding transcriptional ArsR family regulator
MSSRKTQKLSAAQLAEVARLFGALAEPNRLLLLQALHGGPLTVSELVETCALKQANVSRHLSVLYDHRLVRRKRDGACIRYEIADPMVLSLCSLVCGKVERDCREAAAVFGPEI